MSYLVCDKCGGYYELQPGESPEDFNDKCECEGNLKYVKKLNDVNDTQSNKIESKFRFHPVLSIILGVIAIVFFIGTLYPLFKVIDNGALIITPIAFILGGFITTYFSSPIKIRYSVYTGIILSILTEGAFWINQEPIATNIVSGLVFIAFLVMTSIGGFLGRTVDKRLKQNSNFE